MVGAAAAAASSESGILEPGHVTGLGPARARSGRGLCSVSCDRSHRLKVSFLPLSSCRRDASASDVVIKFNYYT